MHCLPSYTQFDLRFYSKKVNCTGYMEPKIKSINIHALFHNESRGSGPGVAQASTTTQLPAGLKAIIKSLLEDYFSVLLTTNKQPEMTESAFVFLVKISEDIFELEEKKEGKRRLFKLILGSNFLSINQRRAMGDDFKLFSERLKILGIQLQRKPYKFWAKFLKDADGVEEKFQPVQNSDLLSQKTAGALLQLAQKIARPSPIESPSAATGNATLTQLEAIKEILLSILETARKVVITNSGMVKNNQKSVYTFSITAHHAIFTERSSVMQNKWELDLISMKSTLNQVPFSANSANWLSMKIDSVAQDILANRAEMYRK